MPMTPVGLTSRWVAANRALETESPNPLYSDPFARELAGEPGFQMMAAARAASDTIQARHPDPYLTIRTKFFDDSILEIVGKSSIKQAVILAAGMDARGLRLDWPDGLVLFEVDRDEVFEHKEAVLTRLSAKPTCDRRIVRADLADQWTEALVKTGFDSNRPSAFLIEGLLMYLDEPAVAKLFADIRIVASEGSWMGVDLVSKDLLVSPWTAALVDNLKKLGCPWTFGVIDPETFLADHGWQGTIVQAGEPAANFGRWPYPVAPRHIPGLPRTYLISARRNRFYV
jgi:methyltransferase (TIGR00027 family)